MDENIVYHVSYSKVGRKPTLHTDRGCRHLKRADNPIREKDRGVFPADHPECSECAGKVDRHRNDKEPLSLVQTLSDPDFGPEDAGLSPIRGGDDA